MSDEPPEILGAAPGDGEDLRLLVGTCEGLLLSNIEVMNTLMARIRTGEHATIKAMSPAYAELAKVLRLAVETQRNYDEWRKKTADGPAVGEIDFAEVRRTVGSQLDRLRAAIRSGHVS